MNPTDYNIFPLGEAALTINFGNTIDEELNEFAIGFAEELLKSPFEGFVECVPAYSSVSVFYNPSICRSFRKTGDSVFDAVARKVSGLVANIRIQKHRDTEAIEIPVEFSKNYGPDLDFVASHSGLDTQEVINIFTSTLYRVYMLGFLPGFPYMGQLDERIAAPRLETPRMKVPKGSVGIAGRQTGIYPLESPGGWQLIGRTETELFSTDEDRPTLFSPGDLVRFVRI